jgi:hypothetical protein
MLESQRTRMTPGFPPDHWDSPAHDGDKGFVESRMAAMAVPTYVTEFQPVRPACQRESCDAITSAM